MESDRGPSPGGLLRSRAGEQGLFVMEAQGCGKASLPSRRPKTQEADLSQGPVKAAFTLLPLDDYRS